MTEWVKSAELSWINSYRSMNVLLPRQAKNGPKSSGKKKQLFVQYWRLTNLTAKGNQRILLPSNRSYIEYAALKSENGVLKSSLAFEREIKERFETQKQAYN